MNTENTTGSVSVVTAEALLLQGDHKPPLKLDSYQRGFAWDGRRMRQLVDDLARHVDSHKAYNVPYYLGTVLIHEKPDDQGHQGHFVIDGQQRIAALVLLWKSLRRDSPERVQFEYAHMASRQRLKAAYHAMQGVKTRLGDPYSLFQRICVTQVVTSSEDNAFSFFDSQNSRGVPLEDTDLLKAFHLDAIRTRKEEGNQDDLQKEGAQRWEKTFPAQKRVTADWLFKYLLTPARRAPSGRPPHPVSRPELLSEFRDSTCDPDHLVTQRRGNLPGNRQIVPCFPSPFRTVEANLQWSRGSSGRRWQPTVEAQQFGTEARDYPFSLHQPLSKGMGFFLYAERYAALARELSANPEEISVCGFSVRTEGRAIFNRLRWILYSTQNKDYLARTFLMAGLLYVDRFEEHRLGEFALWLEHLLGSVRIWHDRVHEKHPFEALQQPKGQEGDLFTLLSNSFLPDPVIGWAQQQARRWQRKLEQIQDSAALISRGPKFCYILKSAKCFGLESGYPEVNGRAGVNGRAFQKQRLDKLESSLSEGGQPQ